jgi:integrase
VAPPLWPGTPVTPLTYTTARDATQIEPRGPNLRVKVYAGLDPVTSKRVYLQETIPGNGKHAWREANSALARLIAQVDKQRSASSSVKFRQALDEFVRVSDLEETTRDTYRGYVDRTIKPALGDLAVKKVRARQLESFYAELRRCRARCGRKPFIERHRTKEPHDCRQPDAKTGRTCRRHECRPMAESTVRQIHWIISGALNLAERWSWIEANPARSAKKPKQKAPEPDPPTPREAARLVEEAFRMDDDWGTLVWLVMTTGVRRGEVCALRFYDLGIDFDDEDAEGDGLLRVRRSYVRRNKKIEREKDTKTHQMRLIALDSETVQLLREHRERVKARLAKLSKEFTDDLFVFTGARTPDHSRPCPPDSITQRYGAMAQALGIDTHIHALRHYSATELLTAGVDLRTVAGRLGHGGGGATTLRVYAAWVAASDRKAAEIMASRMPRRRTQPQGEARSSD